MGQAQWRHGGVENKKNKKGLVRCSKVFKRRGNERAVLTRTGAPWLCRILLHRFPRRKDGRRRPGQKTLRPLCRQTKFPRLYILRWLCREAAISGSRIPTATFSFRFFFLSRLERTSLSLLLLFSQCWTIPFYVVHSACVPFRNAASGPRRQGEICEMPAEKKIPRSWARRRIRRSDNQPAVNGLLLVCYFLVSFLFFFRSVWVGNRSQRTSAATYKRFRNDSRGTQPIVLLGTIRNHILKARVILFDKLNKKLLWREKQKLHISPSKQKKKAGNTATWIWSLTRKYFAVATSRSKSVTIPPISFWYTL